MKKMLCVLLAAITLTACGGGESEQQGGESSSEIGQAGGTQGESRLAVALALLASDTFSLEVGVAGEHEQEMIVRRRERNLLVRGFSSADDDLLLVDGIVYQFDRKNMVCRYSALNETQVDELLRQYGGISGMLGINEARLTDTGTAEFGEYGELYYEEFSFVGGSMRTFFDGSMMVGMERDGEEMAFRVSGNVDSAVFEIPQGFEMVDSDEIQQDGVS
jgi:hypothetical protein